MLRNAGFRRLDTDRAFTLLETLTALAMVAILAVLSAAVIERGLSAANKAQCLSNQRQIGLALITYANEHAGVFPPTTHSTGSLRKQESWVFQLSPYLEDVDEVRVCPADPPARRARILEWRATSYVLNDLVFDRIEHNALIKLPRPAKTMLLTILSENRPPSATRDHIHGDEWIRWSGVLSDAEPDRHRVGNRSNDRTEGSSNYLYADGRVENIAAVELRRMVEKGINPAAVPTS